MLFLWLVEVFLFILFQCIDPNQTFPIGSGYLRMPTRNIVALHQPKFISTKFVTRRVPFQTDFYVLNNALNFQTISTMSTIKLTTRYKFPIEVDDESTTMHILTVKDIIHNISRDPQILAIIIGSIVLLFFLLLLIINKCCCRKKKVSQKVRWKYKIIRERSPRLFRFLSVDSDESQNHYPSSSFDDSYSRASFQRREQFQTQRKRLPIIKIVPSPIMQVRPQLPIHLPAPPPPVPPVPPMPPVPPVPPAPPVPPIRLRSPPNLFEPKRPSQEPADYNINESIV